MGLDCYIYAVPKYEDNPDVVDCTKDIEAPFLVKDVDGFTSMPFYEDMVYWRKNWVVERFCNKLYFKKAYLNKLDVDDDFNCCYVKLEPKDIEALIEEVKEIPLEDWRDETIEDDKYDTLEKLTVFLSKMKNPMYKGMDFYFTPWW